MMSNEIYNYGFFILQKEGDDNDRSKTIYS